ncbi:MAG TPA: AsmA family protein, partial [Rhodanobacter sp.]|nr:AsmA family protein [Rhodanobacter sp.]
MSRRLRLVLLMLGGFALAVVLAAVIAVYLLLQPERFTRMLQTQARTAGLELSLASPASPTLFPRPALDLDGITLNAEGASAPILLAAHGQLVLPWHTVLGGPTVISQLQIESPRVDLDALQEWLAALPAQPEGAPPNIPRIDTGVSISHGSVVRGNEVLLGNVSLEAGSLISGQPFPLALSAVTAAGMPLQLRLSATPRIEGNALQLNNITLHLSQGSAMTLALTGNAHWHGAADAAASLAGKLDQASA